MSDKPIKIMQVISRLSVGGAPVYTMMVASKLSAKGYASAIVSGKLSEGESSMVELMPEDMTRFNHVYVPRLGREIAALNDLIVLFQLFRLFLRERPDVVHTHASKAGVVGRLAAFLALVPIRIHSFHGTIFKGYFGKMKVRFFLFLEKILALMTDVILTDTERVRQELIELGIAKEDKIRTMTIGLALDDFKDLKPHAGKVRLEAGVPPGTVVVGIVARLVPIKRVDVFLEAAKHVLEEGLHAHFVITGDGELRSGLQAKTRLLGLEENVTFLGYWKDLREVYADYDILALSSDNEGCPVSILEAMAAGVPVVATSVGGVPDVIRDGDNGLLVAREDPTALADAIVRLATDKALASRLAGQARIDFFKHYTLDSSVARTESLYRECLKAGDPEPDAQVPRGSGA